MSFDDYSRYFSCTTICKYHDDYHSTTLEINQLPGKHSLYLFQIDKIVTGYISINHLEKRFIREELKGYNYSPLSILLARVEQDGSIQSIGEGANHYGSRNVLDFTLTPGIYILYVRVAWSQKQIHQFCLNAYTSSQLIFYTLENVDEFPLVAEILKSYCRYHKEKLRPMSANYPMIQCMMSIKSELGFAYEYYYNTIEYGIYGTAKIISNPKISGLEIAFPPSIPPIDFIILPSNDDIILYRITENFLPNRCFI